MAHAREPLEELMTQYFDTGVDWATFAVGGTSLAKKAGGFDPFRRALVFKTLKPTTRRG